MSTRCQIGFYYDDNDLMKPDALIYKHSDGYPDGVLPILVPFLKLFQERRGLDDVEYVAAWTMHHLIAEAIGRNKEFYEKYHKDGFNNPFAYPDGITCLGYGISNDFHGDLDYYYAVRRNKLEVYKVNYCEDDIKFSLIEGVHLVGEITNE
jgi:hypothetical protein